MVQSKPDNGIQFTAHPHLRGDIPRPRQSSMKQFETTNVFRKSPFLSPNISIRNPESGRMPSFRNASIRNPEALKLKPLDSGLKIAGMTEKGRIMRVLEELPELRIGSDFDVVLGDIRSLSLPFKGCDPCEGRLGGDGFYRSGDPLSCIGVDYVTGICD